MAKRASCWASSAASFSRGSELLDRCARLEHRRVRRDGEEILRETVVDLARHACALLGDGAAELGEADRAPRADEDQRVREHAQEVALRDVGAREQRLEDEVQRREEHQREAEREPAREVVVALAEALAPADDGDERDQRLQRERAGEVERLRARRSTGRVAGSAGAGGAQQRPGDEERDAGGCDRVARSPSPRYFVRPRANGAAAISAMAEDRRRGAPPSPPRGWIVPPPSSGPIAKANGRERGDEEPAREQEVEPAALDGEARRGEDGDEEAGEGHRRLEDEPQLRQVPARLEHRVGQEQRQARAEQPGEQDLAQEPGLVLVCAVLSPPSCRQKRRCR